MKSGFLVANANLTKSERKWLKRIQEALSFDLLESKYAEKVLPTEHYVTGHCSVATEAAYHLFGKKSGFKPFVHKFPDELSHWWLFHPDREVVFDATALQESVPDQFDYRKKPKNFRNGGTRPSKRALLLMIRVELVRHRENQKLLEQLWRQVRPAESQ